jgi:ABC-type sugar transport system substrate-binding protein
VCLVPPVVLLALGISIVIVIGVVPVSLGLVALTFQEWRPRTKERHIVLIGKSKKGPFSESVLLGLHEELKKDLNPELTERDPEQRHESGSLAFQLEALRGSDVRGSDAVVVIPTGDYEELWNEIRYLTELGIFLVVIDVKAPNRLFYSRDLPMPRFVTSDFRAGGKLVGKLMASKLQTGAADMALVLGGPAFSPPAVIRNRRLLYELLPFGHDRLLIGELDSWDEDAAVRCFTELTGRLDAASGDGARKIVVFCGNDKNCLAIGKFLEDDRNGLGHDRYELIGYDGVRDSEGTLLVAGVPFCSATIDTTPRSQGRSAARFLVDGYQGLNDALPKNSIIAPKTLRRPNWA